MAKKEKHHNMHLFIVAGAAIAAVLFMLLTGFGWKISLAGTADLGGHAATFDDDKVGGKLMLYHIPNKADKIGVDHVRLYLPSTWVFPGHNAEELCTMAPGFGSVKYFDKKKSLWIIHECGRSSDNFVLEDSRWYEIEYSSYFTDARTDLDFESVLFSGVQEDKGQILDLELLPSDTNPLYLFPVPLCYDGKKASVLLGNIIEYSHLGSGADIAIYQLVHMGDLWQWKTAAYGTKLDFNINANLPLYMYAAKGNGMLMVPVSC